MPPTDRACLPTWRSARPLTIGPLWLWPLVIVVPLRTLECLYDVMGPGEVQSAAIYCDALELISRGKEAM